MVKTRRKEAVVPSTSVQVVKSKRLQSHCNKNDRNTDCAVKQIQLHHQTISIRKCVVKIKRLRLQTKGGAASTAIKSKETINTLNKVNNENKTRTTVPSAASSIIDKTLKRHQSDSRTMGTVCATDDTFNLSAFQPGRNSTMLHPNIHVSKGNKIVKACRVRIKHIPINKEVTSVSKVELASDLPITLQPRERSKDTHSTEGNKIVTPCRVRIKRIPTKEPVLNVPTIAKATSEFEKPTVSQKSRRFFHRDQPLLRKSAYTRNVYEFLSMSQIRDSDANEHVDPAADIIKKLVDDGKACLFMRSKKTGKMRPKALKRKIRPIGKRKQCSLQKKEANKQAANNEEIQQQNQNQQIEYPLSPIYEPEYDLSFDDEPAEHIEVPLLQASHRQSHNHSKVSVADGTFSNLARSVIVNQAKTYSKHNTTKRLELLDIARKYVSTPVNRNNARATTATALHTTAISPIAAPPSSKRQTAGVKSPWRVSEDAPLPNTFVFGFNTSHLPSYSSDFIRRPTVYVPDEAPLHSSNTLVEQSHMPELNTTPILDNNDSNGENISPVITKATIHSKNSRLENMPSGQENDSLENFKHMPNPRRTLQHRSPLKDINILEVVVLPSWKKTAAVSPLKTPRLEATVLDQRANSKNDMPQIQQLDFHEQPPSPTTSFVGPQSHTASNKESDASMQNNSKETADLFGFEEFLNDENELDGSNVNTINNFELHERLQRLKDMRPNDSEMPQVSQVGMRYAYDDPAANKPRQLKLQDVLCSTMISAEQPTTFDVESSRRTLFEEIDPAVTFDKQKPRRTYVRERPKRKRKQRVHVLFVDSESSEEDNGEQDSPEKRKENAPQNQPHKRICSRKEAEYQAKLNQYITSFNKECEEVDKFELVIE